MFTEQWMRGGGTETHSHCKHLTNRVKASMPPQAVRVCCLCGEESTMEMRPPSDSPIGHGPFHPGRDGMQDL